jgi:hypothetical protein
MYLLNSSTNRMQNVEFMVDTSGVLKEGFSLSFMSACVWL